MINSGDIFKFIKYVECLALRWKKNLQWGRGGKVCAPPGSSSDQLTSILQSRYHIIIYLSHHGLSKECHYNVCVQNLEIGNSKWKNLTEKGRLHVTILCCYQDFIKFKLIFNSKLDQQIIKILYCFRWRLYNSFRKIDAFHIQKIAELFHWETDMCIYSESCLLYSPNSGGFRISQKYSAHPLGEVPITQYIIFISQKLIEGMFSLGSATSKC